ncbi:MAG: hypothetical protein IID09_08970 [Candidatus Hydrogenedentes bacterium]|nr:hypothetical protein [Candidatus Hydrogenedentota bacterium]
MEYNAKSLVTLALAIAMGLAAPIAIAGPVEEVEGLPRYYEFFMKEGGQVVIAAERERDEDIDRGEAVPVAMDVPLPEFRLPDGFGNVIGLRDYVGKKNVVLTTFRTWW